MVKGYPEEYSVEELDDIQAEPRAPAEYFASSLVPGADAGVDPPVGAGLD